MAGVPAGSPGSLPRRRRISETDLYARATAAVIRHGHTELVASSVESELRARVRPQLDRLTFQDEETRLQALEFELDTLVEIQQAVVAAAPRCKVSSFFFATARE